MTLGKFPKTDGDVLYASDVNTLRLHKAILIYTGGAVTAFNLSAAVDMGVDFAFNPTYTDGSSTATIMKVEFISKLATTGTTFAVLKLTGKNMGQKFIAITSSSADGDLDTSRYVTHFWSGATAETGASVLGKTVGDFSERKWVHNAPLDLTDARVTASVLLGNTVSGRTSSVVDSQVNIYYHPQTAEEYY